MAKSISIKIKNQADDFVSAGGVTTSSATPRPQFVEEDALLIPQEKLVRITIDLSLSQHKKLKIYCATNNKKINEVIKNFIDNELD